MNRNFSLLHDRLGSLVLRVAWPMHTVNVIEFELSKQLMFRVRRVSCVFGIIFRIICIVTRHSVASS